MSWIVKRNPSTTKKKVSIGEVLDAIEQNGLPQAHGAFWRFSTEKKRSRPTIYSTSEVESACAIGQGALNLGCDYSDLTYQLGKIGLSKGRTLDGSIIQRNDGNKWSVQRIAKFYRHVLKGRLDEPLTINVNYTVEKG